eukprot:EG_transcript_194
MDVLVAHNGAARSVAAYALRPLPAGPAFQDGGAPPLGLQLLWQHALPTPDAITVHALPGPREVLLVLHCPAAHTCQTFSLALALGVLAGGDGQAPPVLSLGGCCGVTVVEQPAGSLAAFLPLRRPRLVVADDDGGLAVYRLADGGRCGLLYRCWPLLPDGARMAGLTHPIGQRFIVSCTSGVQYRMQLSLHPTCPLTIAVLDTLKCVLPDAVVLRLETLYLQQQDTPSAPNPYQRDWSHTEWGRVADLLRPRTQHEPGRPLHHGPVALPTDSDDDGWWQLLLLATSAGPVAFPPTFGDPRPAEPMATAIAAEEGEPGSDVAVYFPAVLVALHLLYEAWKLDTQCWVWLRPLATLLVDVARHLQWPAYCLHYCLDWPELLLPDGRAMLPLTSGQPPDMDAPGVAACAQRVAHFVWEGPEGEAPDVYRWLRERMWGAGRPFPMLRGAGDGTVPPTDLTRQVVHLYDLLVSPDAATHARYSVAELYGTHIAERHCSARPPTAVENPAGDMPVDAPPAASGSERVVLGMVWEGFTAATLDTLAFGVAQCLREALFECRNMPALSTHWPSEAYRLIGREDLTALSASAAAAPLGADAEAPPAAIDQLVSSAELKTGCEVGDAGELGRFIWGDDGRLLLAQNMLSSALPVRLRAPADLSADALAEQQLQLQRIANRIFAISVGRGALTLSTIRRQPESLPIPPIVVTGKRGKNEAMLKLDMTQVPAAALVWPEFHNGCAMGLRLKGYAKPSARPSSAARPGGPITRDWILYHFPAQPTAASAGMLLALGLQGHLATLALTDVFRFMALRHDPTTIAVLLGLAATHRGTMTAAITSMLSLHLAAIAPAYPDLEVSLPVQTAALIGVGLLYQGSTHRFMSELVLGELGRAPSDEHCVNREGYAWAAGVALGLVCLARGTGAESLADLGLDDKLYGFMNGAARDDLYQEECVPPEGLRDPDEVMRLIMRRREPTHTHQCSRVMEGRQVNVSVTGAGATMALMLTYLMTNNESVAARLAVPRTRYLLDSVTPDAALLRVLACSMVLWDRCMPTEDWLLSNVPTVVRSAVVKAQQRAGSKGAKPADLEAEDAEGHTGGLSHTLLMYSHMIAGGILAMGIRYAGSERCDIRDLMLAHLRGFMDAKAGTLGLSVLSATASRASIDPCIHATVLAVACVMAGSGDFETLGILRKLWKREEAHYGQHMAAGMGLGLLFLGAGHCSFAKDAGSVAALLIACYPRFPTNASDNSQHLQALRHFYALAAVPSMLETRDVDTGLPCYLPVQIHLKKGATVHPDSSVSRRMSGPSPAKARSSRARLSMGDANVRANQLLFTPGKGPGRPSPAGQPVLERTAPCLMPPLDDLAKLVVKSPRYFPLTLDTANEGHLQALQRGFTIFVKRRAGFLSYFDDPKGVRNLLSSRTIGAGDDRPDGGPAQRGVGPPLYSDPTTSLFAQYFGGTAQDPLFYRLAIQECLYNENTEMLPVYQWLYRSALGATQPQAEAAGGGALACRATLLWNCRLVFTWYALGAGKPPPGPAPRGALATQRLESGRLLSLDFVKAVQVMVEEHLWPALDPPAGGPPEGFEDRSPCTYLAGLSLTPPRPPAPAQGSPLAAYVLEARLPTADHLRGFQQTAAGAGLRSLLPGDALEQYRGMFAGAVRYFDLPGSARCLALLRDTSQQLQQCCGLTEEDRQLLLLPLLRQASPTLDPAVAELLIRAGTAF